MRCKHLRWSYWSQLGGRCNADFAAYRTCDNCDAMLSLGPSNVIMAHTHPIENCRPCRVFELVQAIIEHDATHDGSGGE